MGSLQDGDELLNIPDFIETLAGKGLSTEGIEGILATAIENDWFFSDKNSKDFDSFNEELSELKIQNAQLRHQLNELKDGFDLVEIDDSVSKNLAKSCRLFSPMERSVVDQVLSRLRGRGFKLATGKQNA